MAERLRHKVETTCREVDGAEVVGPRHADADDAAAAEHAPRMRTRFGACSAPMVGMSSGNSLALRSMRVICSARKAL